MADIKVLHVFKTYLPETIGGIEQVIRQLSLAAKPMGVQSDVLTLHNDKPVIKRLDGQIIYCTHRDLDVASTGMSCGAIQLFRRLIHKYDIIHYHYPWPFGDLMSLFTSSDKPSVVTYHSDIVKQRHLERLYSPLQQHFLKKMHRIVATSENYLQSSKTLQPFKEKCSVIPIGISRESYPSAPQDRITHWQAQLPETFFLFVGVLRYYKGLHILLDALQHSQQHVVIAGSGPMEAALKSQAQELNLTNVHFPGQISEDDKFALLELCSGVVLPSHLRSEAFGVTLLEGAMYGKPLISCEIGTGTSFINRHDLSGIVVPPEDPQALSNALERIATSTECRERFKKGAAEHYASRFTDQHMAESYTQLYRQLLAQS